MGASDYILDLRSKIGHDLLLLPGVTVVVVRQTEFAHQVLLTCRSDNAEWTPITGCVDPGEDVDTAALRECLEETGVRVAIDRVLALETLPESVYPNGDRCQFFDVCLLAHPVSGEAHVADEESSHVAWRDVEQLPPMRERFQRQIQLAFESDDRPAFGADIRRY